MRIDPNYMATDDDWRVMRETIELGLYVSQQLALKSFYYREDKLGIQVQSSKAIDEFLRDNPASVYNLCDSCKIDT